MNNHTPVLINFQPLQEDVLYHNQGIEIFNPPEYAQNVAVQCDLNTFREHRAVLLNPDGMTARRRIMCISYILLIVGNVIGMSLMHILDKYVNWNNLALSLEPLLNVQWISSLSFIIIIAFYVILYYVRFNRRKSPWKQIVFALICILDILQLLLLALRIGKAKIINYSVYIITQLLVVCLFSLQTCIKLNFFFILILSNACTLFIYSIWLRYTNDGGLQIPFQAIWSTYFILYDTQLMFRGFHGYHLEPDEYMFAATNVNIEYPVVVWYLVKTFFWDSFVSSWKFILYWCTEQMW